MAQASRTSYSKSNSVNIGSKAAGNGSAAAGSGDFDPSTTHYLKDTEKNFVDGLALWEKEGQFGNYIKVVVGSGGITLPEGTYFLSAKKGHSGKVIA